MPRSLLVVVAHPDDESFAAGGALARYSAEGARTVIVTCTGGEAGEISDASLASPETLGDVRASELLESVAALGVGRSVLLGYRDSGMARTEPSSHAEAFFNADLDEAVHRLHEVMRAERPQVVICPNEAGDYGHPDHLQAHRVACAAFERAADDWRPRKLYYTATPRSRMEALVERMRALGIESPFTNGQLVDPEGRPVELGTPDELITTAVDVSAYLDRKRASLFAHRTQFGADHFLRTTPEDVFREMWSHEHFRLAAGPRGSTDGRLEDDLFAGL